MIGMFLAVCPANAIDYFVDPNGSDSNDGSIGSPFETIGQAVTTAAAGDTIFLRGGTHGYLTTISISKNGTSTNPITMQAYQDESVVVDFNGQPFGSSNRGIEITGSYWHLKGFTIQKAGDNGLNISGNYNIAEQIVGRMNSDSGLQFGSPASYNLFLNCDSYLNYDSDNGEDADGFAAKASSVGPGNIIRGCRAWYNVDDGFDFYRVTNSILVEDCWAFRNGINFWGSPFSGDGNGFKLGIGSGAHKLIRCVAYDTWHNGIDINGNTSIVEVYNCTAVDCRGKNFYFDEDAPSVLRNNISYDGGVNIWPGIDDQYNSWNAGFSVGAADFVSLDPTGIDGPREKDGSLPKLSFLRLARTSSLIDAGIDVEEPYHYSAPDLGAFEHIDGDCQPDGDVDLADLACLVDNWLDDNCGTCNGADFYDDDTVNFRDFAIMAENWMQ